MAHQLELTEHQVGEMAAVLSALKNERAQAVVDGRRSLAAIADALAGTTFDAKVATTALQSRVTTAEHMRDAVQQALQKTHALLTDPQRQKLAFLLRSGQLVI
jgi:Spy/CpxP family protein refolding chaperone